MAGCCASSQSFLNPFLQPSDTFINPFLSWLDMSVKLVQANSIKVGSYIVIDEVACRVSSVDTSKPGKHGSAKCRIVASGLLDGKRREIVTPATDNVQVPVIEKKTAQVLSVTDGLANVMDEETYETFDLTIPDELKESVEPNAKIIYWIVQGEKVMKQLKSAAE